MTPFEFYTESNEIIVKDSMSDDGDILITLGDNTRYNARTCVRFQKEDIPSLATFLEKLAFQLKKRKIKTGGEK